MKLQGLPARTNTQAYDKVLHWFFSYPEKKFTLTQLCENLDVAKTTMNKIIRLFEKENFLRKEVIGRSWQVSCDAL